MMTVRNAPRTVPSHFRGASFKSKLVSYAIYIRDNPNHRVFSWTGLEELNNPAVIAAVLPLAVPPSISADELAELPVFNQDSPQLKLSAKQDDQSKLQGIEAWLEALLPGTGTIETTRNALTEDVLSCCAVYERATKATRSLDSHAHDYTDHDSELKQYIATLELEDRPGCPRFHRDNLSLRLVRTYFGPTTETVNNKDVIWEAFEKNRPNKECVPDLSAIERFPDGSVALIKGRMYHPDIPRSGCVHRSPGLDTPGWVYNSRGEPRRMFLRLGY